ncbi:MAG: exopolysaccharide biosynthesis polyprenyl glycosylphosphotransferase [Actinomycetota bacterium]|nr:exopolysaccharide biosynthesis polyprenyl glycosylphosphotransferase [Actinomycetota bacterium]
MLVAADVLSALLVCGAVAWLSEDREATLVSLAYIPVWVLLAKLQGLYDRDHRTLRHLTVDEVPQLLTWALSGTLALGLLMVATSTDTFDRVSAGVFVVAIVSALCLRALARSVWRRIIPPERGLVVGDGSLASAVRRKLDLFPDTHVRVVDALPTEFARENEAVLADRLVGVNRVILASQNLCEDVLARFVSVCRERDIKLSVVPPVRGMFGTAVALRHIADLPVVEYNTWNPSYSTLVLKRSLDVCVAALACIALLPAAALIALAIRLDGAGPIIFAQKRAGRHGRVFTIYKFRTMVPNAEARLAEVVSLDRLSEPVFKLKSDPRTTRIGRLLRRSSLDELPQLINVLKGEMSLVGPRPEQVELVERYGFEQRFRLDVKPGITGPMQVFGRGQLTFEERLAVERDYIENHSFARDLLLLALTVGVVVGRRGAY